MDVRVVVVVSVGEGQAGREISEERPPAVRVIVSCAVANVARSRRRDWDNILLETRVERENWIGLR